MNASIRDVSFLNESHIKTFKATKTEHHVFQQALFSGHQDFLVLAKKKYETEKAVTKIETLKWFDEKLL